MSPLEPALSFLRELWALDHALGSTSKRMLDRTGITAQQRMVLRFIGKYPEITGGELAVMLHLEKSSLSIALRRLEERGLVARRRDADDARKTRLALTREGRRYDHPAIGGVERAVAEVLDRTNPRAVDAIRTFLQELVRALEEKPETTPVSRGAPKPRMKTRRTKSA